jgi:hypothetical protein
LIKSLEEERLKKTKSYGEYDYWKSVLSFMDTSGLTGFDLEDKLLQDVSCYILCMTGYCLFIRSYEDWVAYLDPYLLSQLLLSLHRQISQAFNRTAPTLFNRTSASPYPETNSETTPEPTPSQTPLSQLLYN